MSVAYDGQVEQAGRIGPITGLLPHSAELADFTTTSEHEDWRSVGGWTKPGSVRASSNQCNDGDACRRADQEFPEPDDRRCYSGVLKAVGVDSPRRPKGAHGLVQEASGLCRSRRRAAAANPIHKASAAASDPGSDTRQPHPIIER